MAESIANKLKKARLLFFSNSGTELTQFLGGFAYKFLWEVHPMDKGAEGYVVLDYKDRGDGRIHINEEYIGKDDYTFQNLCALITHEILHILNKHGIRRGRRDPKMWNIACDHVIDRDLKEIKSFTPYEDRYNIIEELHKQQPTCTAEQAYTWLNKNIKQFKVSFNDKTGMIEIEDKKNGKKWTVNPKTGGAEDEKLTPEERETLRQITEQCMTEARTLHQSIKMKGNSSGQMSEYLEKLLKVEVPWQELLEKAIKTNVQMVPDSRTWSNPNKILRAVGIMSPGVYMTEIRDSIGTLVICVDTSGSISTKTLKQFAGIIHDSMRFFAKIVLVVHDVEVHQVKEFDKDNIGEFHAFLSNEGFKGRGGTSHQYAFDHIQQKIWDDPDERDELSMVISLTDGYSDIEGLWPKYKVLQEAPIVFVIEGDYKLNLPGNPENVDIIHISLDGSDSDDD